MSASSIRHRVTWAAALSLLIASCGMLSACFFHVNGQYKQFFEQALRDDLRTIANITQVFPDGDVYVNIEPEALPQYMADGDHFFQVWGAANLELMDRSQSLQRLGVTLPHPTRIGVAPQRYEFTLPDGRVLSLVALQTRANWGLDAPLLQRTGLSITDQDVHIVAGRLRDPLDQATRQLLAVCLLAAIGAPLLAIGLLVFVVAKALRPLEQVVHMVSLRLPADMRPLASDGPVEVQAVVTSINRLIQRTAHARRQERESKLEIARELHEALAQLHSMADMALLQPGEDPLESVSAMRSASQKISGLAAALAMMAGPPADQGRPQALALKPLVEESIRSCGPQSRRRQIRFESRISDDTVQLRQPALLQPLLHTVLDCALNLAAHGSVVEVSWDAGPERRLCVAGQASVQARQAASSEEHAPRAGSILAMLMGAAVHAVVQDERFTVSLCLPADAAQGEPPPLDRSHANTVAPSVLGGVEGLVGSGQQ